MSEFNPNLNVVSEKINAFSGTKNGSDYLFHVRKFMVKAQMQYEYISEKFKKKLSIKKIFI